MEARTDTKHPWERDAAHLAEYHSVEGATVKGFVIRHEEDRGLPGFINLVGIESPGLTCAPAIAEMVDETLG